MGACMSDEVHSAASTRMVRRDGGGDGSAHLHACSTHEPLAAHSPGFSTRHSVLAKRSIQPADRQGRPTPALQDVRGKWAVRDA